MWDMASEDMEHRQRRVGMYQSQKMNHGQISAIFDQEQKQALELQEQQRRAVQEAQIQEASQTEIHESKMRILQKTEEELAKMENVYDDAQKLAYFLRTKYFDGFPSKSGNSIIIIANQIEGDKWSFHAQVQPYTIDLNKLSEIKIVMKED